MCYMDIWCVFLGTVCMISEIENFLSKGSDNDFTHEFQHKKEHPFTDSAENQQKQFDLLHQMQSDAEMAQRLQEQYNAVS